MFFYNTLYEHRKLIPVEIVGIASTALNISLENELKVENLLILDSKQYILLNIPRSLNITPLIQSIVHKLIKYNLTTVNKFIEIEKGNLIIIIYFYSSLVLICVLKRSSNTNKKLIRLYLHFIRNSFLNFVGQLYLNHHNNNIYEHSWKYLCRLYEIFFVEYLSKKFFSVVVDMLSIEDNLIKDQEKLKNILVIELPQMNFHNNNNNNECITTQSYPILLDLRKLWRKHRKLKLYYNNLELYHFTIQYIQTYNEAYSIKLEFYSTYPRLCIIGKLIKVGNGYAIIEIYTVNKLSRHATKYCEYETTVQKEKFNDYTTPHHNDFKNHTFKHNNKHFIITQNIELFIKEYFSCIHADYCYYTTSNSRLLYFDIDMLTSIDDALYMKLSIDNLISFLYRKLRSMLISKANNNNNNNNIPASQVKDKKAIYNYQQGMTYLEIQKQFIYNVLFEIGTPSIISRNNSKQGFERGLSIIEKSYNDLTAISRQFSRIAGDMLDNTVLCNISELGLNEIPDISESNDVCSFKNNNNNQSNNVSNTVINLNSPHRQIHKKLFIQKRNTLFSMGRDMDYATREAFDKKDKGSILKDIQMKLGNYEVNGMVNINMRGSNNPQTDLKFMKMKTCQIPANVDLNHVKRLKDLSNENNSNKKIIRNPDLFDNNQGLQFNVSGY